MTIPSTFFSPIADYLLIVSCCIGSALLWPLDSQEIVRQHVVWQLRHTLLLSGRGTSAAEVLSEVGSTGGIVQECSALPVPANGEKSVKSML